MAEHNEILEKYRNQSIDVLKDVLKALHEERYDDIINCVDAMQYEDNEYIIELIEDRAYDTVDEFGVPCNFNPQYEYSQIEFYPYDDDSGFTVEYAETQLSIGKPQLSAYKPQLSTEKPQFSNEKQQLSHGSVETDWELNYFKDVVLSRNREEFKNKTIDGLIELFDRYRYSYNFNRRNFADVLNISENWASQLIKKCIDLAIIHKVKRDEYCFIADKKGMYAFF